MLKKVMEYILNEWKDKKPYMINRNLKRNQINTPKLKTFFQIENSRCKSNSTLKMEVNRVLNLRYSNQNYTIWIREKILTKVNSTSRTFKKVPNMYLRSSYPQERRKRKTEKIFK